jgi:hypothetical protein
MLDAAPHTRLIVRNTPTGPRYRRPLAKRPPVAAAKPARVNERFPHKPLTTTGHIATDGPAIVYAAATRDGRIKIGMTARRSQRMERLAARLIFAVEVVREAAKEIETYALRSLGHVRGDGEYVSRVSAAQATEAVKRAYRIVGAYRHVDPNLTDEQARQARIRAAADA